MALIVGSRLGPYEIVSAVGAGGMGEVFRARDTKLNRDVAIKVLPAEFAKDHERVARFKREAQILASLNHPSIAAIHGLEEDPSAGTVALAMEYVDGEDLAQRLARGAIPVDEAIGIAKQIAEGLEEAHEHGIIHRDLKPANVKVTPDGKVKILDFGLAKAMEPAGASSSNPNVSHSPTLTHQGTSAGMIIGTAAYMSPEQAKGKPVDKRADIWAFGVVLFEMLTGERLFTGETVSDVLAAVLTRDPDFEALPANASPRIVGLVRRCLARDPKQRLRDIGEARLQLGEADSPDAGSSAAGGPALLDAAVATARAQMRRAMLWRMPAVALLAVVATIGGMRQANRREPPRVVQSAIPITAAATALSLNSAERTVAITPEGSRVVYLGGGGRSVFVRPLDALEPVRLYTGAPRMPFVSPDGAWIGFSDSGTMLMKVPIAGGPAATLATMDGGSRGAVWMADDTIVFATQSSSGLQQVSAAGGAVTVLTRPDRALGELDHVWPEALPGGDAVLFTIVPLKGGVEAAQVAVFDRKTKTHTVVLTGGSNAHYVVSGHLIYAAAGGLNAVAFDPATRTTRGTPVSVVSEVVTTGVVPAGGLAAAVAADGTLVYVRGKAAAAEQRTFAWIDRQGRETTVAAPPHAYLLPRVSPEGGRVLVRTLDQGDDLWVFDLARQTLTRVTSSPAADVDPVWAPDGRRVFFSSDRDGDRNLYAQAANGTGAAEQFTAGPDLKSLSGVTPDGAHLIFTQNAARTLGDVMQVSVAGDHKVTPLVQTDAREGDGVVSPDGRWLAYGADDSGQTEIYVRPYPDVSKGRWMVSTGGGHQPLWSRDGRELFYLSPENRLIRVGVDRGASWSATTPGMVLEEEFVPASVGIGRQYDVSLDGKQFLVVRDLMGPNATPPQLMIVQHFDELLKRLAPGK